jgi:flagellar FliJ protein
MDSRRLRPIQQIAENRETERARALAERSKHLATHQQRLDELSKYAQEYAQPAPNVTSAAQLLNRRAFLDKLEDAVQQQQQQVRRAEESFEIERARLLLASREKTVLEKLSAAYAKREAHADNQRAQREMDDHAARQHARGTDAGDPQT